MDFRHPIEALIPGVQGRILAVLAETTAEINLRTIARLSGVSPAQASRILPELVTLGVVERREAPPSALFSLVTEHIAARTLRALSRARETVLEELGALGRQVHPRPVSVIVFGSFARGEADSASDLDVVMIRPTGVAEEDERWESSVQLWRTAAHRLTGNRIHLVEVDEAEAAVLVGRSISLWSEIARSGITVYGSPIGELGSRRIA